MGSYNRTHDNLPLKLNRRIIKELSENGKVQINFHGKNQATGMHKTRKSVTLRADDDLQAYIERCSLTLNEMEDSPDVYESSLEALLEMSKAYDALYAEYINLRKESEGAATKMVNFFGEGKSINDDPTEEFDVEKAKATLDYYEGVRRQYLE